MHPSMARSSGSSSKMATLGKPRADSLGVALRQTHRLRKSHHVKPLQVVCCLKCATQQLQQLVQLIVQGGHSSSLRQVCAILQPTYYLMLYNYDLL